MSIPELKQQLSISSVLQYYGLQTNRNSMLRCPFHHDETASLKVYEKTNSFNCFGCGKAGDVLKFIQYKENTRPKEAIQKAKTLISPVSMQVNKTALLQKAYNYYVQHLNHSSAQNYLKERAISHTVQAGYDDNSFIKQLSKEEQEAYKAIGLIKQTEKGKAYSFFFNCLVFPLYNAQGELTQLYGRSAKESDTLKHRYLSGTNAGLYPTHISTTTEKLILTESIIDAISLENTINTAQYNVLALYGVNGLNASHHQKIRQLTQLKELIFFFDGDVTGRASIQKQYAVLHDLYPHLSISYIQTPEGEDVNSLVQTYNGTSAALIHELLNERITIVKERVQSQEPKKEEETPPAKETTATTPAPTAPASAPKAIQPTTPVSEQSGNIYFNIEGLVLQAIGGINLRKTNQLKITIGINIAGETGTARSVRQEVNLYSHSQVQNLIQHTAELLELNHDRIARAVYAFRAVLEEYRNNKQQEVEDKEDNSIFFKPAYQLTEQEKAAALSRLKDPELMTWLYNTIPQTGLIGEQSNGLLLWCCFFSARLSKPISVVCMSQSGAGKSYIIHKIASCCPKEWQYQGTSFSEQSLFSAPKGAFKHCTMIVEDMTGAQVIEYIIREMISSEDVSRFVSEAQNNGAPKTVKRTIEGPMNFIMATTREFIYEDNANRCLLIYLDNSKEQDERINTYLKQCKARIIDKVKEKQLAHQLANLQRMLVPHEVWNIYAECINLPAKYYVQRRGLPLLMQVIDTVTNIHQYQCEKAKDAYGNTLLIPHPTHIEWAFKLTREILFRKSDELTGKLRDLIEFIKQWLQANNKSNFKASDLRKELRLTPKTCNNYLRSLTGYGYLKVIGGSKGRGGQIYEILKADSKESLLNEVDLCIKTVMDKVWELYHQRTSQTGNK